MTQRHLLVCAARTGSTMLRHVINDHSQCINHGEIFKLWRTLHFFKRVKVVKDFGIPENEVQMAFKQGEKHFFENYVFRSSGKNSTVGFKFKTDEFYNKYFRPYAKYVLDQNDIKIIHLKRRDLFHQYISKLTVLNNDMPKFFEGNMEINEFRLMNIKINEFSTYVKENIKEEKETEQAFRSHKYRSFWYEEILASSYDEFDRLFSFLEVENNPISFRTNKIIKDHKALVLNIEELSKYAQNSEYRDRLISLIS